MMGQTTVTLPAVSVTSDQVTYELAAELAAKLYPLEDIMDKFSLNKAELAKIVADPHFKEIYREAKAIWEGTGNVKQRIRAKASMLLEDSILPIYAIVHDAAISPTSRVDAFAKLVAIADMQPAKGGSGSEGGDKFVLNISIGEDKQTVTIDAASIPNDPEEGATATPSNNTDEG